MAKDEVISIELNVDEGKFTRGTSLKINISKGEAPAGVVKIENFKNQTYSYVETWAKNKKITLKKAEAYSDDVAKGLIISQSLAADKEVKEGETLTVTVSLGKGVTVPNFMSMTENDYKTWKEANELSKELNVIEKYYYSDSDKFVIKQSESAGSVIAENESVVITINKGDGFYFEDALSALGYSYAAGSTSYEKLDDWSYKTKELGLSVQVHVYTGEYVESDLPKGTIIEIVYAKDSDGNKYSMKEKLPLDAKIFCTVSSGKEAQVVKNDVTLSAEDITALTTGTVKKYSEWKEWVSSKQADLKIKKDSTVTTISEETSLKLKAYEYKDEYGIEVSVPVTQISTTNNTIPNGATLVFEAA